MIFIPNKIDFQNASNDHAKKNICSFFGSQGPLRTLPSVHSDKVDKLVNDKLNKEKVDRVNEVGTWTMWTRTL